MERNNEIIKSELIEDSSDISKKIITFEDGKLLCDGIEISIAEAEDIIKAQVEALDKKVEVELSSNLNLDKEDIDDLSTLMIETKYKISENNVKFFDLQEYYDVSKMIDDGTVLCTRVLTPFLLKKMRLDFGTDKETETEIVNIKWKGNINNDPNYEPDLEEQISTTFIIFIEEFVKKNAKFIFPTSLNIDYENIFVDVYQDVSFKIEIKKEDLNISFNIYQNNDLSSENPFNYIGTSLKIGEIIIQDNIEVLDKRKDNKFKFAQSLENIIIKQLRFLKNAIKEEINYSLEKSLLKASDRLYYAQKIKKDCNKILDEKTFLKLEKIIIDLSSKINSLDYLQEEKILEEKEFETKQLKEEYDDKLKEIDSLLRKSLLKTFSANESNSKFVTKYTEKNFFLETSLSNQKITLVINNLQFINLSSINTIGTGKNDITSLEVVGKDIYDKIKNTAFFAFLPIITRQIENIFLNTKTKKTNFKEIELLLKEMFYALKKEINEEEKGIEIYQKINKILDFLHEYDDKVIIQILDIIDLILKELDYEMIKNLDFVLSSYKEKYINQYYKLIREQENSIIESVNDIKKIVHSMIYSNFLFLSVFKYNIEKDMVKIDKIEEKIKILSDNLSEDILLGSFSRKILSLMNISKVSRDELFKNNLESIIIDMNKIRFNR
ncbi:MAG: hypothetical protein AABZ74_13900 [Cyanobacteriota bacterium]